MANSAPQHCQIDSSKQISRRHVCTCLFRACIAYSRWMRQYSLILKGIIPRRSRVRFSFHNFGRFVWLMAPKSYVLSSEMVWSSRKHALRVMPMAVSNAAFKERLSEGSQLHPCEIASQTIVWDRPQISVHSVCSSNWQHAFRCSSETNPRQIPENSVGIRGSVVILASLAIMGS